MALELWVCQRLIQARLHFILYYFWDVVGLIGLPVTLLSAALYEKAEIKAPEDKGGKHLIIGVTSDRGLCGAIHSGVAKTIKNQIAHLTEAGKEVMVVNVGDKLRGLLHRWDIASGIPSKSIGFSQRFADSLLMVPCLRPPQNPRSAHHPELQGDRP